MEKYVRLTRKELNEMQMEYENVFQENRRNRCGHFCLWLAMGCNSSLSDRQEEITKQLRVTQQKIQEFRASERESARATKMRECMESMSRLYPGMPTCTIFCALA